MSKKLKFLATMLTCILLSVNYAWGAVTSGTTYDLTGGSIPANWSKNGDWGTKSSKSYLKLVSTSNYLQTEEFCQNGFTSIVVHARTFGNISSNKEADISIEWIETGQSAVILGTVTPSSSSMANCTLSSFTSVTGNRTGVIKLSCKNADGDGAGIDAVIITYTSGSCGSIIRSFLRILLEQKMAMMVR